LRLLIITNDFPPVVGGIENIVFSLADRLPPADVVVLTRLVKDAEHFDKGLPFEVRREPVGTLLPTPHLAKEASRIINERGIDFVYFATPLPLGVIGPRLLRQSDVPYACSVMGADFALSAAVPGIRLLLRKVLNSASVVLPLSSYLAEAVRGLVPEHRAVRILPPGVDTDRFQPPPEQTVSPNPRILFVSRVVARKGAETLIRAMGQILSKHPNARAVFVGGGPERYIHYLKHIARAENAQWSVSFEGSQPWHRLPPFYSSADVFAVPTHERLGGLETEGFGMVYLEAAASGLPVVAGNSGGVADAVIDGETGFIVDGRDPAQVADAIQRLLDDPEKAVQMGVAGRRRAVDEFSWDVIAARFREELAAAGRSTKRG
jgi:phosphatidylinositol alpha-1,6-mannosyltransferase